MANWGAIGQQISQGFNQGFNQGLQEDLLKRRAVEQKQEMDKYIGEQLANMMMNKEKGTQAYKDAQTKEQVLLSKQAQQQGDIDYATNAMDNLINLQDLSNATTDSGLLSSFNIDRKQDIADKVFNDSLSRLAMQQAGTQKQLDKTNTDLGSIQDYLSNPLSEANKRLYDMAMGGNTLATEEIKNILYPQAPDWQLRTTKSFDPATNLYKETDTAYYIDDKGNIVKGGSSTRTTGKDWKAYEIASKNVGGGSGSGSDKARYYTPEQLDELYILNQDIVKMYPQIKTLIGNLNKSGNSALIPDIFSSLNTGYQEVPEYNAGSWLPWDDNNQNEIDRIQAENKNYLATRQEVLNLTGYDIADKNTQALLNHTKQNQLSELKNKGVKITDNKNGTYTLKYGDVVDTISELDLLEKGML